MAKKYIHLMIDEQVDFTTGVLGNPECLATVPVNVDIIKNGYKGIKFDGRIASADWHDKDTYADTWEGKRVPPHCMAGEPGAMLHPDIQAAIDASNVPYLFVPKDFLAGQEVASAVESMVKSLIQNEDDEVEIYVSGVCTGYCVLGNVILVKAALPNCEIHVIEEGCACVTPESHKTALSALTVYADIV